MKILSVVTLVSPLGEYGGPLRVAVNQSKTLAERGHDVTIVGAYRGYDTAPTDIEGVPTMLFPALNVVPRSGFAGLTSPRMLGWLARVAGTFDVAHIHAARDLITLPAARIVAARRLRYVVQSHGMIDGSSRRMAKPLDIALTVPVLKRAHRVFYLTDRERQDLIEIAAGNEVKLAELPNGVPESKISATENGGDVEVLYLARLAPRKRPTVFVRVADVLSKEFPQARFVLVGPDEGEGDAVMRGIREATVRGATVSWGGAVPPDETLKRMGQASIYVLPSVDEPYPMAVLEAMSVGLPVVITDTCGLAEFVHSSGAGIVVGDDESSIIAAVRELLSDPAGARKMGERGRSAVRSERSMGAIASILEAAYGD